MKQGVTRTVLTVMAVGMLATAGCAAKPPKPGPNFVWVPAHKNTFGKPVPGHWKHTGPKHKHKVWVEGHHKPNGVWVPGHWQRLP